MNMILTTKDGINHCIICDENLYDLAVEYMGEEFGNVMLKLLNEKQESKYEIQELEGEVSDNEQLIEELESNVEGLEDEVNEQKHKVEELEGDVEKLENRIKELERENADNERKINMEIPTVNKNLFSYWYDKVKDCGIRTPRSTCK